MYGITRENNERVYGLKQFVVDSESDIATLPTLDPTLVPGSTAFVIATSNTYMLNNKRSWVKLARSSSSTDTPDPDTNNTYIWDGSNIG